MKNSPKGFLVLFLVIMGALGVSAVSYYVKTHPIAEAGLKVDLVGVNIKGEIPESVFRKSVDYLVERLGSDYVKNNIFISIEQNDVAPFVDEHLNYKIAFIDKNLTKLLDEPNKRVEYFVYITDDNFDLIKLMAASNIPNCVKDPSLCEIHVTKEEAMSAILKTEKEVRWGLRIETESYCLRNKKNSTNGFFWTYFTGRSKIEINISNGEINKCGIEGDF